MRDLLLRRPVRDADLAVEGDAATFAGALAARLGAAPTIHARFSTATLELPEGGRLDLAGTRRETYPHPGALPVVESGASIEADLARRDFSIHAMAVELAPRGRLLDPFGGRDDLARRRIRFLHPASPGDDPTRALRAVRYAVRLGFRIAPEARRQIAEAIASGAFDAVSGDRLRRELALILSEPERARAPALLHRLGVDRAVAPGLARAVRGAAGRIARASRRLGSPEGAAAGWVCYLLAWMAHSTPRDVRQVAARLSVAGREGQILRRWPQSRRRLTPGLADLAPSKRRRRVAGLSAEEVFAAASLLGARDARALLGTFAMRAPELAISGADLLSRGVPPGPSVGRALEATRAAREDGRIDAARELDFALAAARRRR